MERKNKSASKLYERERRKERNQKRLVQNALQVINQKCSGLMEERKKIRETNKQKRFEDLVRQGIIHVDYQDNSGKLAIG